MAIPRSLADREQGKFIEVQTTLPAIRPGDVFAKKIVDEQNSVLTFIGESVDPDALTSEAKWRISRITTSGTQTTTEYAGTGLDDFTQVWDDRASAFPAPSFDNEYSTAFDGINDRVDFGDIFTGFDVANQFSMSCWVKVDNLASRHCVFSKTSNDSNVYGYSLQIVNPTGKIFVQMRVPGGLRAYTTTGAVTASTWYHIVMTYNGGNNINGVLVYIDSVVEAAPASGSLPASWLNGDDFLIGTRNATTFPFSGNIDEFTVWDKQLAQSEVNALYNSGSPPDPTSLSFESNLVSYWKMGDGDNSTTIFDNRGSNDGTLTAFSGSPYEMDVP